MELIFSEDVNVELLDAEKHSRLDHGKSFLQPLPTGHHCQVHGRLRSALNTGESSLHLTPLTHDVPEQEERQADIFIVGEVWKIETQKVLWYTL